MQLSAVAIGTVAVAAMISATCADNPTSPVGRQASWTQTLDLTTDITDITSIAVTCTPDPRVHICSATASIANGPPRDLTNPIWKSSNPAIGTVSPAGVVTHVRPGLITISAASGAVVGSTIVVVD